MSNQKWIFTFGFGHVHPITGESLANCYVVIEGDVNTSREVMYKHFGNKWAFQYPGIAEAGVHKWSLREIQLPESEAV